jgi:hypothetical protein
MLKGAEIETALFETLLMSSRSYIMKGFWNFVSNV